jgi:hypothetical protein
MFALHDPWVLGSFWEGKSMPYFAVIDLDDQMVRVEIFRRLEYMTIVIKEQEPIINKDGLKISERVLGAR